MVSGTRTFKGYSYNDDNLIPDVEIDVADNNTIDDIPITPHTGICCSSMVQYTGGNCANMWEIVVVTHSHSMEWIRRSSGAKKKL